MPARSIRWCDDQGTACGRLAYDLPTVPDLRHRPDVALALGLWANASNVARAHSSNFVASSNCVSARCSPAASARGRSSVFWANATCHLRLALQQDGDPGLRRPAFAGRRHGARESAAPTCALERTRVTWRQRLSQRRLRFSSPPAHMCPEDLLGPVADVVVAPHPCCLARPGC
jgi:hypothetical protein